MEVGVRLGQVSEFALLIAVLAQQNQLIGREASYLVQATTLLTFIVSTYYLVLTYPTPVAISDSLRRIERRGYLSMDRIVLRCHR